MAADLDEGADADADVDINSNSNGQIAIMTTRNKTRTKDGCGRSKKHNFGRNQNLLKWKIIPFRFINWMLFLLILHRSSRVKSLNRREESVAC